MEAFKIKNGLSAKRYLGSTSTLSGSTIDLSLGSMFSTTLSSDPAYTFTNPPASGNAQAFSVEVTGGTTTFTQDSFATTLYDGTNAAQTITNGLDLAGDGGMLWFKNRGLAEDPMIVDTVRGGSKDLYPNEANAEDTDGSIASFNSDGFTFVNTPNARQNVNGYNYVSWAFKKQAKFFDVVTYTGDGTTDGSKTIAHNLSTTVGSIIIKGLGNTFDWRVWHRNDGVSPQILFLNQSYNAQNDGTVLNVTDTDFSVAYDAANQSGVQYVAYLFAHDTASDSRIKCGSYTEASSGDQEISIGWAPQWIMVKASSTTSNWLLFDTVRGMSSSGSKRLLADTNAIEITQAGYFQPTATGFLARLASSGYFGAGTEVVYMAIRGDAATDSAITWPSSVKWPSGVAPTTPAAGTKDLFTFLTTDGGTTYYGKKAAEGLA